MKAMLAAVGWGALMAGQAAQLVGQPISFRPDGVTHADTSTCMLSVSNVAVVLSYDLNEGGWVNVAAPLKRVGEARPMTFVFQTAKACSLELKFVDADGSVFGQRVPVEAGSGWQRVVAARRRMAAAVVRRHARR